MDFMRGTINKQFVEWKVFAWKSDWMVLCINIISRNFARKEINENLKFLGQNMKLWDI